LGRSAVAAQGVGQGFAAAVGQGRLTGGRNGFGGLSCPHRWRHLRRLRGQGRRRQVLNDVQQLFPATVMRAAIALDQSAAARQPRKAFSLTSPHRRRR